MRISSLAITGKPRISSTAVTSMASVEDLRRSSRQAYPSEVALDQAHVEQEDKLLALCRAKPGEDQWDRRQLGILKVELVKCFNSYQEIIFMQDRAKTLDENVEERRQLESHWEFVKQKYKDRLKEINLLRASAGDDQISSVNTVCYPAYRSTALTTEEKCQKFVNGIPTSACEVIPEDVLSEEQFIPLNFMQVAQTLP